MPIKIPRIAGGVDLTSATKDWLSSVSSYAVTNINDKVSEMTSSVLRTNGGSFGNFINVGANTKSVAEIQSAAVLERGVISPNSLPLAPMDKTALTDLSFLGGQPPEAQISAKDMQRVVVTGQRSQHRVSLKEVGSDTRIFFEVMPEIVEQHTVEYEAIAPPQFPGAFQKYKGNSSTQWQLNITFIARTTKEASDNYRDLLILRGWTKPYYGANTGNSFPGKLGAPPPVLMLSGLRDLIGPVPVVITSLNWSWPKDVDYIATDVEGSDGKLIPFPVVMQVPIQLVESYSIVQFNNFSLEAYRAGKLTAAFNATEGAAEASANTTSTQSASSTPAAEATAPADKKALNNPYNLAPAPVPEPPPPLSPKETADLDLRNKFDTAFGELYTMSQITPSTPANDEAIKQKRKEVAELRLQRKARGV